jgi:hypothetical protein
MADLADVENAVEATVTTAVYPSGSSQPSIIDTQVSIARGWPVAADIDTAMAAGNCIVSIYSQPNVERNTTRYPRDDQVLTAPVHTLTVAVSGNTITIGGTVATPQNVIVLCGPTLAFAYSVQSNDTLASIATALAALIAASFPGTAAAGDVITIAGKPGTIRARVASQGTVWTEQRRQERGLQVTCWCPTPSLRDALVAAIDVAFAQIDWLTLADQSAARIRYERTIETDAPEKVLLFRRDLFYTVEYPTATITTAPETAAIGLTATGGVDSAGTPAITYV